MKLAGGCNPNIIELFFLPPSCVLYKTGAYDMLVENRGLFVTRQACDAFTGYAHSQLSKSRSTDKMANEEEGRINVKGMARLSHLLSSRPGFEDEARQAFGPAFTDYVKGRPLPEERLPAEYEEDPLSDPDISCMLPPSLLSYVKWLRTSDRGKPFRAEPFTENPSEYDAVAAEGGVYRLYGGGKGFVSQDGTQTVCRPVDEGQEAARFRGLIVVNFQAFEHARKEYARFWDWMNKRSETRYAYDWDRKTRTDNKSLMHLMRLLICAEAIADTGVPRVRFEGPERDYLMSIREGRFPYDELKEEAEKRLARIKKKFASCPLPEGPDWDKINDLYDEIVAEFGPRR